MVLILSAVALHQILYSSIFNSNLVVIMFVYLVRLESYLKIKILYFTWLNKKKRLKIIIRLKETFCLLHLFLFAAVAKICSEISAMYKNVTQLYIFIRF